MFTKSMMLIVMFVTFFSARVTDTAAAEEKDTTWVNGFIGQLNKAAKNVAEFLKCTESKFTYVNDNEELKSQLEKAGNRLVMLEFREHESFPKKGDPYPFNNNVKSYSHLQKEQYDSFMERYPGVLILVVNSIECKDALAERNIVKLPTFSFRKLKKEDQSDQIYVDSAKLKERDTWILIDEGLKKVNNR